MSLAAIVAVFMDHARSANTRRLPIYRPEIYNANSAAGTCYRPDLKHEDYSLTQIVYDREERGRLGVEQARFAEKNFITPHRTLLEQWSSRSAL